jgi:NADPH-dependent 2,4-dienoyl-CoA reductase/sulfur reductase-like enzyme
MLGRALISFVVAVCVVSPAVALVSPSAARLRVALRAAGPTRGASAASAAPRVARAPFRGGVRMAFGVVITGGANGVGFAYADEFLKRGHKVVICDVKDTALPIKALQLRNPAAQVFGTQCDVSSAAQCHALAEFAKEKLG